MIYWCRKLEDETLVRWRISMKVGFVWCLREINLTTWPGDGHADWPFGPQRGSITFRRPGAERVLDVCGSCGLNCQALCQWSAWPLLFWATWQQPWRLLSHFATICEGSSWKMGWQLWWFASLFGAFLEWAIATAELGRVSFCLVACWTSFLKNLNGGVITVYIYGYIPRAAEYLPLVKAATASAEREQDASCARGREDWGRGWGSVIKADWLLLVIHCKADSSTKRLLVVLFTGILISFWLFDGLPLYWFLQWLCLIGWSYCHCYPRPHHRQQHQDSCPSSSPSSSISYASSSSPSSSSYSPSSYSSPSPSSSCGITDFWFAAVCLFWNQLVLLQQVS